MSRQPAEPLRIIRGIRLSRLPPVVIADPERNGEVSRKRSPVAGTTIAGGEKEQIGPRCDIALCSVFRDGRTSS